MNSLIRHGLSALVLLGGCVGGNGEPEKTTEDAKWISSESDVSAKANGPSAQAAAQVVAGSSAACADGSARAPASGLRIREIALYQAVKVPLMQNGTWVTSRAAPVVQNKKSQVRVFVDTLSGYRPRALRGTLTLQTAGVSTELVSNRNLTAASKDEAADSTFTFDVPADKVGADTQLSVALTEADCVVGTSAADPAGTRFPSTGLQALGATQMGKLKVVLVPLMANNRAPKFSDADVKGIREALLAYYPVPGVEVTVRSQPLTLAGSINPSSGTGWSQALSVLTRQRATDKTASDVYYFGLMQPAATQDEFCRRGCILGMSPQLTRVSAGNQVGIAAWFPGTTDAGLQYAATVVGHELGHAHGRGHAPCPVQNGPSGIDRGFPGAAAAIVTWGWNSRTNQLQPPTNKDIMGYCTPFWISTYTYQALAVRSQAVNIDKSLFVQPGPGALRWHTLLAYTDGRNQWVGTSEVGTPGGDAEPARVLDAAGNLVTNIEVARTELSHTTDQFLQVPEPGHNWAKIVLRDRVIDLSEVAPPL